MILENEWTEYIEDQSRSIAFKDCLHKTVQDDL